MSIFKLFSKKKKEAPIYIRDLSKPLALGDAYYEGMAAVEQKWSVLSNLKDFTGTRASDFELLCHTNIKQYKDYCAAIETLDAYRPPRVPAFIRLAMLYEKQGRYEHAIKICADAIRCGTTEDGSNGGMRGRLARLIKKSEKPVSEDILALLDGK